MKYEIDIVLDCIYYFGMTPDAATSYVQNFPIEAEHRLEVLKRSMRKLITV